MMEKEGGACNSQPTDLGRLHSYLQCPSRNPSQQFYSCAEPNWGHTLTKESGGRGAGLPDLAPQMNLVCPYPHKELNPHPL